MLSVLIAQSDSIQEVAHRDLYIVLSIMLLGIFATSKVIFPKLFTESFSAEKLFGFRVKEDLGSTIRPFSTEHIYFTALYGFNLAFIVLFVINEFLPELEWIQFLSIMSFGHGLLLWLLLGIATNLVIYLKYALIILAGWLFHTRQVVSRHFTDFINTSSLFYVLVTISLSLSTYTTFISGALFARAVMLAILFFLFYRTFLLYIKLLQLSPYSKLYIFSYICTTELIPVLIGLKFLTT